MITKRAQQKTQYKNELYRIVFSSVYVKCGILFLFVAFLIQPIAPAFANESNDIDSSVTETIAAASEEVVPEETKSESDSIQIETEQSTEEPVNEIPVEDKSNESNTDLNEEEIAAQSDEQTVVPLITETEDIIASTSSSTLDTANEESEVNLINDTSHATTATTTDPEIDSEEIQNNSEAVSDNDIHPEQSDNSSVFEEPDVLEESVLDTEASEGATDTVENDDVQSVTSQEEASTTTALDDSAISDEDVQVYTERTLVNDQNRHQFSKDDCVAMGDGSFFCSKPKNAPTYAEDGVFSVPDAEGDMEIVVRINGEETYITDNQVDDLAPYYDALSDRIVWHTLQNDRYQIASYDLKNGDITYLTDSHYNNMAPVAYGDNTLWQAWVTNNWEIMLFDGATTTQLTNNTMNDIAPQIRNGYIIWQTQFADGWKVAMYDQNTKQIEYIGDADGALAANPRFVLVYDSLDENGDIRTVGFDLDSREEVPFAQVPSQLPDKLPEPQGTDETRALIQNKSHTKDVEVLDVYAPTGSSTPNFASSTDAVTGTTLDLSAASTTTSVSTTTDATADVVMPSNRANAEQEVDELLDAKLKASSTDHIDDVVIPPLATSTDEVME